MGRTIIRGGTVIDPGRGVDAPLDVVIEDGRVVALDSPAAPDGPTSPGAMSDVVLDATDAFVVPGLIDLHAHWYEGSPYGVEPAANLRGGVTCSVDAGTAGYTNFDAFRRLAIDTAPVRLFAFVHVAAAGLAVSILGELEDIRYARPTETAAVIRANRDVAIGVKVRIGTGACGSNNIAALDAALEAAESADVPLMAHIADGAEVGVVASRLRSGDVITHALTGNGMGILDRSGRIRPEVRAARARGVRFDVGHGCGSFSWAVARRALDEGFQPDSISTDLHRYSIGHPVVDLPTTMAKLAHVGMSRDEVLAAVTTSPAAVIGREGLGSLRVGGPADVTVLRPGPAAELVDSNGVRETVDGTWLPAMAVVGGAVHRSTDIEVRLRPYLDADYAVDCTAPL